MIDPDGDHDQRQRDSNDDQEVSDLKHRLLCVANCPGAGYKFGRSTKKGVGPGRDDNALHLTLLNDAA